MLPTNTAESKRMKALIAQVVNPTTKWTTVATMINGKTVFVDWAWNVKKENVCEK